MGRNGTREHIGWIKNTKDVTKGHVWPLNIYSFFIWHLRFNRRKDVRTNINAWRNMDVLLRIMRKIMALLRYKAILKTVSLRSMELSQDFLYESPKLEL